MCDAVTGGDQVPDQEENSLGSDSQPPPGQDSLERDLGGDSWEQGSGSEGAASPAVQFRMDVNRSWQAPESRHETARSRGRGKLTKDSAGTCSACIAAKQHLSPHSRTMT